jgi:hypothetical protein
MGMGMRLKSFRRGPLAAEGSGPGRSASALPEALEARCEMSWRHMPASGRLTDGNASPVETREGARADQGLARTRRLGSKGPALAAWPLRGPPSPSVLENPLARRSVLREPCPDCAVECQPIDVPVSSQ